jgi:peptidoglycan/xylan/chitin deacetylase (PgdA/CDA1 family)
MPRSGKQARAAAKRIADIRFAQYEIDACLDCLHIVCDMCSKIGMKRSGLMERKKPDFIRKSSNSRENARRKEQLLHNALVVALWVCVLLPLLLCIILFAKVGSLEKELKEVKEMSAQATPGSFEAERQEMALELEKEDEDSQETGDGQMLAEAGDTDSKDEEGQEQQGEQEEEQDGAQPKEDVLAASSSAVGTENGTEDEKKHVYLTFDDGPSDHTEDILELLENNGMTATFFCIGKTDDHSKEMYKRIVEGGHTLAMHSYSHDYSALYESEASFTEDLHKVQDYFEEITGIKPVYYRFPGGSSNTVSKLPMRKYIKILYDEGISYFDWNALNGDAEGKTYTVQEMLKRTMSGIKAYQNPVVLMHDTNAKQTTLEMLPKLIKKLKKMDVVVEGINENTPLVQHIKVEDVIKTSEN